MKRRALACCLTLALSFGLLAGCGGSSSDSGSGDAGSTQEAEKVFTTSIASFPDTLNPTSNIDLNMRVTQALFDCLYAQDANGDTTYYLAESCEPSEDGMSYTLTLKDNITWSDGEAITADDVIFTTDYYKEYVSAAVASLTSGYTCEKVDDTTVTITLDAAESSFQNDLGSIRLLPAHVFDSDIDSVDGSEYLTAEKLVGSGAYTIAEENSGESYVLTARDDYYGGTSAIETLNILLLSDSNAEQLSFDSGELSCYTIQNADDYEKYNTDDYTISTYSSGKAVHLQYNPDGQSKEGLTDEQRQAVAACIDRQEIVDTVYGTDALATPLDSMFASTQDYYDDSITHETDADEAKSLAESSGLVDKTIHIIYNTTYSAGESLGVVIQQQLADAGVTAEVQGYDATAFYSRTFHAATGATDTAEATDWDYAIGFDSGMYGDASANQLTYAYMGLLGETTSGLTIAAYSTADETEREELFKQAQQAVDADGYWIPLVEENTAIVFQKNVTGYDKNMKAPIFINYAALDIQ